MSKRIKCDCGCGQKYRRLPPGAWISTIGGWHRARIATDNCDNEEIGCGNDPDRAAQEAWWWWIKMAKRLIRQQAKLKG